MEDLIKKVKSLDGNVARFRLVIDGKGMYYNDAKKVIQKIAKLQNKDIYKKTTELDKNFDGCFTVYISFLEGFEIGVNIDLVRIARNLHELNKNQSSMYSEDINKVKFWRSLEVTLNNKISSLSMDEKSIVSELIKKYKSNG